MNKNCYHLQGPSGVRFATQRIREVLSEQQPMYVIRADIRSFYKSIPHPRTLRKAREQVKQMVNDGVSPRRIRSYLHRWGAWWVRTSETWGYQDLLVWFLEVCRDPVPAAYAAGLYYHDVKKSRTEKACQDQHPVFEWGALSAA